MMINWCLVRVSVVHCEHQYHHRYIWWYNDHSIYWWFIVLFTVNQRGSEPTMNDLLFYDRKQQGITTNNYDDWWETQLLLLIIVHHGWSELWLMTVVENHRLKAHHLERLWFLIGKCWSTIMMVNDHLENHLRTRFFMLQARLMANALPNSILCDDTTRRRSTTEADAEWASSPSWLIAP